ncbi:MAG: HAD family phosphatase [Candidatus Saccharimonas sp.]
MKKLAIFDLDGTLYRWQLFHEVVFELKERGMFTLESAKKLDDSFAAWNNRQESFGTYERQVVDTLVESLPSIPPSMFDEVALSVSERSGRKTYRYTLALMKQLKSEGYFLLAVSGSQQEVAELFARKFEFDDCIGSLYERVGDHFTGAITRFVPGHKDVLIREYAEKHDFTLDDSVAVGDSDGDISMLEIVDHPIAFNPNDKLLESAQKHGWKVVVERKNVALTLEVDESGTYKLAHTDVY